ncbi:MAG: NTP transferase domain-containing protein [Ignavibacteriales bacterium]|nr:NTP transferase domain-containing protein [Ignavibacteriales bacterium]
MSSPPTIIRPDRSHFWGVILAGGDGKRVQGFLRNEFGFDRPKQFCALSGKRSMLRHTIDRISSVIMRSHVITVIGRRHYSYALEDLYDEERRNVVLQPFNCERAPGILLPLVRIQRVDPQAIVAIFPADHFILEERRFMEYVDAACAFVAKTLGYVVTLGVRPACLQPGYGWIEKGDIVAHVKGTDIFQVRRFWEKPSGDVAERVFRNGCLWNTMTMVGRLELFIRLFKEFTPEMFGSFQRIWQSVGTPNEENVTDEVFRSLPRVNFSHAVLERAIQCLCVLTVRGVYWSDWGDENRIRADLAHLTHHKPQTPRWSVRVHALTNNEQEPSETATHGVINN